MPAGVAAQPQAITAPPIAPPAASSAAPTAGVVESAALDDGRATAPLNLELPRGAAAPWRERSPALDEGRAPGGQQTLEARIARALGGSDQIIETRLADGSVRLQRGHKCVVARSSLAGETDGFNTSSQMRPRLIRPC